MGFVKTAKKLYDLGFGCAVCVVARVFACAGSFQLRSDADWAMLWSCMGGCGRRRFGLGMGIMRGACRGDRWMRRMCRMERVVVDSRSC